MFVLYYHKTQNMFVCLFIAASSWPLGHPRSDRYVRNLRRPESGREDPQCSSDRIRVQT